MTYHKKAVALALVLTISMTVAAFAQTAFEQNVARAIAQAEQKQQQKNAVVNISVYWSNANQAEQYTKKQCKGILAQDGQVLFPAVCLKNASSALKEVGFVFSNGQIQSVATDEIKVNADMASVTAKAQATKDLQGLPTQKLPFGQDMRPFFKKFLLSNGVQPISYRDSNHDAAYVYREPSLSVGDPVIYQGKVIALVKEVPNVACGKAESYFAWLH